jgi:hypothetical protein
MALVAAVFLIVVIAFFGLIMVSLVSTQSFSSMNEVQSDRAYYLAEGGMEFAQRALAENLNWYRSTTDPILIPATNLGAGTFNVSMTLPVTMLRNRMVAGAPTMTAYTTGRFPAAGFLQIDDDITGSGEFVRYTGIAGNTFTGLTRGEMVGTVGSVASDHSRGDRVYPVTTLVTNLLTLGVCAPMAAASFQVVAHPKFLTAGTIDIEGEEIRYTGSTTGGGNMTLTGVTRCVNSFSSAHPPGQPVTPILVDGAAPDYESEPVSTGTVGAPVTGNAVRVIRKTVQR